MQHVLILGGYGATGRMLARLLLEHTPLRVTLAGRNAARAEAAAARLATAFGPRVDWVVADAASAESLTAVVAGVDLLLVASSTAVHTQTVARAAFHAGADYYDILYSPAKLSVLRSLEPEIRRNGCCFITDGGFHPGLPAILVRRAAGLLDELHTAQVGSVVQQDWRAVDPSPETVAELLDTLADTDAALYAEGEWRRPRLRDGVLRRRMEFGEPLGSRACYAMALEEMRALPQQYPTLRSTGFYVGGFSLLIDWGVVPLAMLGQRFAPHRSRGWLTRLLGASLRRGSNPPFRTVLKLEASGVREGKPATLELDVAHPDGYFLTAACVLAGVQQLLDGSARRPGVWLQGQAMEPGRMLTDLERVGVEVAHYSPAPAPAAAGAITILGARA